MRYFYLKFCFTAIGFLFFNILLNSQLKTSYAPYYQFDTYTSKNGLSNNQINDIFQDSNGFLWFATSKGLNRYDGYSFKQFLYQPENANSISGNIISSIVEDGDGNLWIGTDKGLDLLDIDEHIFKHIFPKNNSSIKSKATPFVRALFYDDGILWFETADGFLNELNTGTMSITSYKHQIPGQIYTYLYHTIYKDSIGDLWIGGRGIEVCKFDNKTKEFSYYLANSNSENCKRDVDVTKYYEDTFGEFWVSGTDGLYLFDKENETFQNFIRTSTFDILDYNNNLYIATGQGLKIYDKNKQIIYSIEHINNNPKSLPHNHITKLFVDNANNLWIGTREGVCKYSLSKNKFQSVFHIIGYKPSLSSNYVKTIMEDDESKIWVGYDNDGIDILNQNFLKIDHLDITKESPYSLASNRISKIFQDKDKNIYIGLWDGVGFQIINEHSRTIGLYKLLADSRKVDWYNDFIQDSLDRIWIGTWGSYGLAPFDIEKRKFINMPKTHYPFFNTLSSHFITCLMEDSSHRIWIGTSNVGLSIFDPQTKQAISFKGTAKDSTVFFENGITALYRDKKNRIWIGSNGLYCYNTNLKDFNHYTVKNGLADNTIQSILEDDIGNLWIATTHGLTRYNFSNDSFSNYYSKDGLPSNEFTTAAEKLKDGRLVFGTKDGIAVFKPSDIVPNLNMPKPIITDLKIFEKSQNLKSIESGKLEFDYDKNYLKLEFTSTGHSDPMRNKFAFKLFGFETQWHNTDAMHREAYYTYLEPGSYNFQLKVANSDGLWSDKIEQLGIVINPPFWKTWWFILLEVILAFSTIYLFVKDRERKIKKQHKLELLQQRLLRTQMNPHFIFNALGAIQHYILNHNPIDASSFLSRFADLMRSTIYNSKVDFIPLSKEVKSLNNYMKIQQLRFENKFDYSIFIDPTIDSDLQVIPPMLIQPLVENAIEHGFKKPISKGSIIINFIKKENCIHVSVIDNGIGLTITNQTKKGNKHLSFAIDIIRDRLNILNEGSKDVSFGINIKNIIDDDGNTMGVEASFNIPLRSIGSYNLT